MSSQIVPLFIALFVGSFSYAHEKHHHSKNEIEVSKTSSKVNELQEIYTRDVKPIFVKKCFDCHSSTTNYPWYYRLPFAKGMIDQDVTEAKKHLDMSNGFPFKGHGTLEEDLEAIAKSINEKTMPPLRYRILHPGAIISEQEKTVITQWIKKLER
jgi:hypothetical protein